MTNADRIRIMDDEELIDLLVWRRTNTTEVPECDEGCDDFKGGCANGCPHEKQERAVREWLQRDIKEVMRWNKHYMN